ncbi:hypothetical protein Cgig2_022638 [Carnegiea gigantea]|uniref:Agglutinin domain-containing protein n=1 Tax=Carnegiea gigantea TaxID=171969 RepID=A0A9Q1GK98_9CARY|nr:hypothetical protein Cgig2_022638 [Carnegiea gigantea]
MAAFALPSLVCLRSVYNDKYLRYRYENVQTRGLLQFAGENVMDPYAQFEVEKAKTWASLVHLKSRYTNKYLVRWSPNHDWITASAYTTNEDQSSWAYTLFKPILIEDSDGTKKLRLLHVQLGNYACLSRSAAPLTLACLRDPRILTKTHATFSPSLIGNPSSGSLDVLPSRVTMASSWGPLCTMASLALDLHSVILRIPRWCNKSSQLRMEPFS